MSRLPRVLLIDDDPRIGVALGDEIVHVDRVDASAAVTQMTTTPYSVIVADLSLPRIDVRAFVNGLRDIPRRLRPIVLVIAAENEVIDSDLVHGMMKAPVERGRLADLVRDCANALQALGSIDELRDDRPDSRSRLGH